MPKPSKSITGMTLIEVLVALAVVSMVFSALTQMTFDSLQRVKKLELQDKMRNYATEAVQVLYNEKDANWTRLFASGVDADGQSAILPPVDTTGKDTLGYLVYKTDTKAVDIASINSGLCSFDSDKGVMTGPKCVDTAANEASASSKFFGRLIIRSDNNTKDGTESQDTENDADIEIIVACIEGKCSSKDFQPFRLTLKMYRTGGSQ